MARGVSKYPHYIQKRRWATKTKQNLYQILNLSTVWFCKMLTIFHYRNQEVTMNTKQTTRWWVDAILFTGFMITFFIDFTGLELHQWIGVLAGTLAVYHLLSHWDWVSAVTQRFFGKTSGQARRYYVVDAVIMIGLAVIVATGLIISTWFNLSLTHYSTWLAVHIIASIFTLLALVLKLTWHARWIASAARGAFAVRARPSARPVAVPARANVRPVSRREFLEVMGVAGAASLLALIQGADGLRGLFESEAQAASPSASQTSSEVVSTSAQASDSQTGSDSSSASASSSSTCSVRCNHRCSYPGHCRRYADSNNNGYCDMGECV
jgi:hypothetical protein